MLESAVEWALPMVISLCEFMGIFIVAVSALGSFGRYLKTLFTHAPCDIKFQLANGLALSLEFKMAQPKRITQRIQKAALALW